LQQPRNAEEDDIHYRTLVICRLPRSKVKALATASLT
jgi:hypothetical protein